jgi:polar amino acid transport system substrate-binding protein
MKTISDPSGANLLPIGKIRLALYLPLYAKDSGTGEIRSGAAEGAFLVTIARAIATRLGVELQLKGYPTPLEAMAALKVRECDLGFFGIDPVRANDADFSPPFVRGDFTYLVPASSKITSSAEVDRPGINIAVVRNHGSTKTLSQLLTRAKLVYGETPESAVNLLRTGQADAMASVRSGLLEYSVQLPGSRVLEDRYGELLLALAVPKGTSGWLAYVSEFLDEAKASGLVQRAIDKAEARGLQLALSGNFWAQGSE